MLIMKLIPDKEFDLEIYAGYNEIDDFIEILDSQKKSTWNPKQPVINGCFNWMIPNLYMENGCFTKHP